ncbi:hypothetical protein ABK040_009795 [Willaertia magna]
MSRITERSNVITKDIDIVNAEEMIRLLRQSDSQLFTGYDVYPSIFDKLDDCVKISNTLKEIILSNQQVIFSGCGTSGRLAYFCAKNYNYCLKQLFPNNESLHSCFKYLIAGGVNALVTPQEGAEDNPIKGKSDVEDIINNDKRGGLYVGITCGLSAAYVAGQLMYLNENKDNVKMDSVLLGFNNEDSARDSPIEGWKDNLSFKKVVEIIKQNDSEFIVLNPIVGPEGITGSTRMKGGSATKILLDVVFAGAVLAVLNDKLNMRDVLFQLLSGFEQTVRSTYDNCRMNNVNGLPQLIEMAAQSLKHQQTSGDIRNETEVGHIYYVGCDNAGTLGFIDASECPPTYGAHELDVRGFLHSGWKDVFCDNGEDRNLEMSKNGECFNISFNHLTSNLLPHLNEKDSVFFIAIDYLLNEEKLIDMTEVYKKVKQKNSKTCWIVISSPKLGCMFNDKNNLQCGSVISKIENIGDKIVTVNLPHLCLLPHLFGFAELSLKLVLNSITTGAHVSKGMTYGNRMINLKVSNNKLFFRAVGIVSSIMNVDEKKAQECLLRAIYDDNLPTMDLVSMHIKKAVTC